MYNNNQSILLYNVSNRDVAQLGSALPWGGRGRQFKSGRSDQLKKHLLKEIFLY